MNYCTTLTCPMSISNLSPKALKVFIFLSEKANNVTNASFWRKSKIAEACKMSTRTLVRAVNELKKNRLISVDERYETSGRQKSNLYTVLKNTQTRAMKAPKDSQALSGTILKVYMYLLMRCGLDNAYCINMREIAKECGLKRGTAQFYITRLKQSGYILSKPQTRRILTGDDGCGYNEYTVFSKKKFISHYVLSFIWGLLKFVNQKETQTLKAVSAFNVLSPSSYQELSPLLTPSKLDITSKKKKYSTKIHEGIGYIDIGNDNSNNIHYKSQSFWSSLNKLTVTAMGKVRRFSAQLRAFLTS